MLQRDLQNSAESAKSTAPSRPRLSKSCCFNAGIMSRARKQAVCGILQVPLKHALQFRLGRRQFPGDYAVREAHPIVGAVAKRLIGGVAAAAERNYRPASQAERGPGRVYNF